MVNKERSNVRKSGYIFEYRLAFLGDSKTGKTSVLNRFVSDTFTHRYRPTIEDHITHIIDHNGNMCVCLMVDTSGSCDFPAMRRLAITKGNAFLVFYSVNDRRTFEGAKRTVDEIKSLKPSSEDVKILIIGNKNDLERERKIQRHEGEELVQSINNENVSAVFFECSAKNNQNIDLVFTNMLDMFIPEENEKEVIQERSTFTRMSLRKKARKHRLEKQAAVETLSQQNTTFSSDMNLSRSKKEYHTLPETPGKLLRASSVTSGVDCYSSSDSGNESGSKSSKKSIVSRKEFKRQNSAKNVLKKTFGSMQKLLLLKPEHDKGDDIKRSSTLDNKMLLKHKQTTI